MPFLKFFLTYCAFFQLVFDSTLMIDMAPVQRKNKKYSLKFKLSVLKYAEENLGEAAMRHFSDPKRVRDQQTSTPQEIRVMA